MTHDVSRRRRTLTLRTMAVTALLVGATACSTAGADPEPVAATAAAAAAPSQASSASALSGPNLGLSEVPAGTVVTNDGFTVYRFEKDTSKPSRSSCNDACATAWPPVMATDTPWLKGISQEKVGTVKRSDGSTQLTLGGWPVYRYAKDTAPGDTKGHGVGGTWCAVGPDDKPAKLTAPAASSGGYSEGGSSSGGYSAPETQAPATQAPATQAPSDSGYSSGGY